MSEVELVTRLREFVDGTRGPYTNIACDIGKVCDALEAAEAQVAALREENDLFYAFCCAGWAVGGISVDWIRLAIINPLKVHMERKKREDSR